MPRTDGLETRAPEGVTHEAWWGVNVAGYLQGSLGLGEAARLVVAALDAASIPVMPVELPHLPRIRHRQNYESLETSSPPFPITVACGGHAFQALHTVGFRWADELDEPGGQLDEIWVASRHAAEALAPLSGVPVSVLRLPVEVPECPPVDGNAFRLPAGFRFLTSFDYGGSPERKNPLGAIRAFKAAFPPGSGASLVVKSTNGHEHPDDRRAVESAAADHPDVHVRDRYVVPQVNHALIAACDCYVSLHRSTSFGLAPAKAMYLGKPVIATARGGNVDYMDERNSFLVESEEAAAVAMRTVFEDRAAAAGRGRRGAETIRERHSPEQAARSVASLLEPARVRVAQRVGATPLEARPPIWADSQRRAAELADVRRTPNGDDSQRARLLREIHSIPNWWHSIDLGDGIVTPGSKGGGSSWMATELECLRLPDVRDRTVLDVGAWDGFYSFEAERRGASRVVALDWHIWRKTPTGRPPADPESLPGKRGFDIARAALSSAVEPVAADFMEADVDGLGSFHVVLFLGVLYHLQDPLGAMRRLAQVTQEVAVIESEAIAPPGLDGRPLVEFFGSDALAGDGTNWWVPSLQALQDLCEVAGFSRTEVVQGPPPVGLREPHRYRAVVHAFK